MAVSNSKTPLRVISAKKPCLPLSDIIFLGPGVEACLSSQYKTSAEFGPQKAHDGIYVPVLTGTDDTEEWFSLANTLSEKSPWIEFDLKQTRCIVGVLIWNRSNGKAGMTSRPMPTFKWHKYKDFHLAEYIIIVFELFISICDGPICC